VKNRPNCAVSRFSCVLHQEGPWRPCLQFSPQRSCVPERKKENLSKKKKKEKRKKKKEKKSSLIGARRHKIWRTQLQGASARQGRKSIHIRGQASKATNIFCLWTKEGLTVCRAQKCGRVAANEAVLSKRNPLIMVPHCTD